MCVHNSLTKEYIGITHWRCQFVDDNIPFMCDGSAKSSMDEICARLWEIEVLPEDAFVYSIHGIKLAIHDTLLDNRSVVYHMIEKSRAVFGLKISNNILNNKAYNVYNAYNAYLSGKYSELRSDTGTDTSVIESGEESGEERDKKVITLHNVRRIYMSIVEDLCSEESLAYYRENCAIGCKSYSHMPTGADLLLALKAQLCDRLNRAVMAMYSYIAAKLKQKPEYTSYRELLVDMYEHHRKHYKGCVDISNSNVIDAFPIHLGFYSYDTAKYLVKDSIKTPRSDINIMKEDNLTNIASGYNQLFSKSVYYHSDTYDLDTHFACYTCKMPISRNTKSVNKAHVIPHCRGGQYSICNIRLTCVECNQTMGSHHMEVWHFKRLYNSNPPARYDVDYLYDMLEAVHTGKVVDSPYYEGAIRRSTYLVDGVIWKTPGDKIRLDMSTINTDLCRQVDIPLEEARQAQVDYLKYLDSSRAIEVELPRRKQELECALESYENIMRRVDEMHEMFKQKVLDVEREDERYEFICRNIGIQMHKLENMVRYADRFWDEWRFIMEKIRFKFDDIVSSNGSDLEKFDTLLTWIFQYYNNWETIWQKEYPSYRDSPHTVLKNAMQSLLAKS